MLPRKSFVLRTVGFVITCSLLTFVVLEKPFSSSRHESNTFNPLVNSDNLRHSMNAEKSKDVQLFNDDAAVGVGSPTKHSEQRESVKNTTPNAGVGGPAVILTRIKKHLSPDQANTSALTEDELEELSEHDAYVNISSAELRLALEGNVVNPHDFNVVINSQRICARSKVFLVIYVHSAPDHFRRRNVIRETWANPSIFRRAQIRTVFMIGKTPSESVQKSLVMESDIYGDIVQEDYVDSYKNLTYKGIQGLKWISQYCAHATYVLKTDDDIFVNIYSLIKHLQLLQEHKIAHNNTILCNVWSTMVVMRDKKSKWYVSREEFKDDMYPTYCSGSAYLFTSDLVPKMYLASKTTKFFWVDDFYVTGLLAQKVNASFHNFNSLYVLNVNNVVKDFTGGDNWTWVFGHLHGLDKMYFVWKMISEKFNALF